MGDQEPNHPRAGPDGFTDQSAPLDEVAALGPAVLLLGEGAEILDNSTRKWQSNQYRAAEEGGVFGINTTITSSICAYGRFSKSSRSLCLPAAFLLAFRWDRLIRFTSMSSN